MNQQGEKQHGEIKEDNNKIKQNTKMIINILGELRGDTAVREKVVWAKKHQTIQKNQ